MICELGQEIKSLKTRWVFKIKLDSNNLPERCKARLVVTRYNQKYGIGYNETFAPVIKRQASKLVLAIEITEGLKIHHIDISNVFLDGELVEEVNINPPEGFNEYFKTNLVLKLNKALYIISTNNLE